MSFPDNYVPLSVRRGIRSREEWEAGIQKAIEDPETPEHVREALIRGQEARDAEARLLANHEALALLQEDPEKQAERSMDRPARHPRVR